MSSFGRSGLEGSTLIFWEVSSTNLVGFVERIHSSQASQLPSMIMRAINEI